MKLNRRFWIAFYFNHVWNEPGANSMRCVVSFVRAMERLP